MKGVALILLCNVINFAMQDQIQMWNGGVNDYK